MFREKLDGALELGGRAHAPEWGDGGDGDGGIVAKDAIVVQELEGLARGERRLGIPRLQVDHALHSILECQKRRVGGQHGGRGLGLDAVMRALVLVLFGLLLRAQDSSHTKALKYGQSFGVRNKKSKSQMNMRVCTSFSSSRAMLALSRLLRKHNRRSTTEFK